MPLPTASAVARYNLVRNEVQVRCPESWAGTVRLCERVPAVLNAQQFWMHGRDRPCWSNITVDIGRRIASDLQLFQDFNSYERIADPDWSIQLLARGSRWKANRNYELAGQAIQDFVQRLKGGGLRSYLWRLYAIRGLAIELSRNGVVRAMIEQASAAGTIQATELEHWTKQFASVVS